VCDDVGTPHLHFERRGPIAWCTIDRPASRNALTPAMYRGIGRAVEITSEAPDLKALIITGVDDVFVPGGDIGADDDGGEPPTSRNLPFTTIRDSRKPVIAAINGICQASGLVFALLADVAVASERATFRAPELIRGFPEMWTAAVLPAHVGVGRARELMLTARKFNANEARAIGVVSRIVQHDRLHEAAQQLAFEILECAPHARNMWKQAVNAQYCVVDEAAMDAAMTGGEVAEGFRAFLEKRAPSWSPRCR
jgi:enoyl-CoA hydratase/carnithine racemase